MVTALVILIILFVISIVLHILWLLFMYSYAKDWPNEKDDFDFHMMEIYNKLKKEKHT